METKEIRPGFYGWKNAGILFCTYGVGAGLLFYSYMVIFPVMIEETGWGRDVASAALSIRVILLGFLTPLAAFLVTRIGAPKTIAIGFSIMLVGTILLGTAITELWHWTLLWGVVIPFGSACVGLLPTQSMVIQWFNVRRATVIGLVMASAALAGALAQPAFTWLMETTGSWQWGWLADACFVVVVLVLAFFLKNKPEDVGQSPDGLAPEEVETLAGEQDGRARTHRTREEWTLREAVKCRALWCGMFVHLAQIMALYIVVSHGFLHLTDLGYTKMQAASVGSVVILGSGLIRFPIGWLGDMVEPRWLCALAMAIMALTLAVFWWAPGFMVLMVTGPVLGFCLGTILVLVPASVGNYWGADAFPSVMGFIMPFVIVLGAPTAVVAGRIYKVYGNYNLAFIFILIMIAVAVVCAVLMTPPFKNRE
ncbi:MAG: MFS transporter [Proteobacteria bacterium]|nr:MFS transporter [Pseudomonadota bacterium]